jgi:hypothetical protein
MTTHTAGARRPSFCVAPQAVLGTLCAEFEWRGEMAEEATPSYSIVKQENGWFWSTGQEIRGRTELVGPFPSQQEAEKDARETIGPKEGE